MSTAGLVRSLPEIVRRALQARLADVHTKLPGRVVSYDASTNLAEVEIMVKHPVFDDDGRLDHYEDLGILAGVPVKMPRAGGFLISLPLAKDDEGELNFHSTPIGEWRATGQKGEPKDASRHSLGWPTFEPNLFNDKNPIASSDLSNREAGIVIGKEGSQEQILLQDGLIKIGRDATDFAALAAKVDAAISAIVSWTGSHTHTGVTTGTGSSGTATPLSSQPSTANALVKLGP